MRYLQRISDPFEVKFDLKQRDAFSPALFNLALPKKISGSNDNWRMEVNYDQVMFAYTDHIEVMDKTKEEVINATSKFINASKGM